MMPLTVHIVNTPLAGVRDAYLDAWREIDTRGLRHPHGRQLHVAWTVDDVLHVVDVWKSPEQQQAFMRDLGPILDQFGMEILDAPEVGEFLHVVQPPA
jgi:hypothetical protein